jgi:hypothetical protein
MEKIRHKETKINEKKLAETVDELEKELEKHVLAI